MGEQDKRLTEAEKQIRRLEALRQRKDDDVQVAVQTSSSSQPKTRADQMAQRLMNMRDKVQRAESGKPRPRAKIEGKQRSSKLTYNQIGLLERILQEDKRLRGSVITRIALNRLLGLELTADETDLEERLTGILRQFRGRP